MSGGAEISLRIGQRVRHRDRQGQRVTGVIKGLAIEGDDNTLMAHVVLDAPIVIPPSQDWSELRLWHQTVPAHELAPFDERDEIMGDMLAALRAAVAFVEGKPDAVEPFGLIRAAIAKATGAAA